jgi:hypothetical protein
VFGVGHLPDRKRIDHFPDSKKRYLQLLHHSP